MLPVKGWEVGAQSVKLHAAKRTLCAGPLRKLYAATAKFGMCDHHVGDSGLYSAKITGSILAQF